MRLVLELNSDVDVIVENVGQYFVDSVEFHGCHGVLEVALVPGDDLGTTVATADRTFLLEGGHVLEDPHALRALKTEEFLAGLTVVSDVLEIELALACLILTVLCACGFLDQVFHFCLSGKV